MHGSEAAAPSKQPRLAKQEEPRQGALPPAGGELTGGELIYELPGRGPGQTGTPGTSCRRPDGWTRPGLCLSPLPSPHVHTHPSLHVHTQPSCSHTPQSSYSHTPQPSCSHIANIFTHTSALMFTSTSALMLTHTPSLMFTHTSSHWWSP